MSKRGMKLARLRRMLGGGVPAAGVTRVSRRSAPDTAAPGGGHAGGPGAQPAGTRRTEPVDARRAGTEPVDARRTGPVNAERIGTEPTHTRSDAGEDGRTEATGSGDGSTATSAAEDLGAGDVHGRVRTVAGFGSYKGVHRREAA